MTPTHLDRTMMALADPTRRAILTRLSRGEARVTELARPFDMSLNAVSKHILILERAQLVRRRVEGRDHFLSVNAWPLDVAAGWIDKYREMWEQRLDRLDAYLKELQATDSEDKHRKRKGNGRRRK